MDENENSPATTETEEKRQKALNGAALIGHVRLFKEFLAEMHHDVLEVKEGLSTLLYSAACTSTAECLRILLEQDGSRVNVQCKGLTPLMMAALQGSVVCVEELLKYPHLDINVNTGQNKTALSIASNKLFEGSRYDRWNGDEQEVQPDEKNYLIVCRLLIEHGADVNVRDDKGHLLLHRACESKAVLAADLVEIVLPKTIYDSEAEAKLTRSPMQLAIEESNYHTVKSMLKFANQSDFVVPNKETVDLTNSSEYTTIGTNIAMLFDIPQFGNLPIECELIEEMLNLGWKFNYPSDDHLSSAMVIFCDSFWINYCFAYNYQGRFHSVPEPLMDIFISNGAYMSPSEAERVVNELLTKHECYPLVLKAYTELGLVPPETLLKIDWNLAFLSTLNEARIHVMSAVSLIFILNENFGNQGPYWKKISEALDIKTQYDKVENNTEEWLREKREIGIFKKDALDSIKAQLRIGSLGLQSRAVIRKRLMAKGHFHPWQMKEALKNCIPMESLIKFIIGTKIEDWPEVDPIDIEDQFPF